MNIKVKNLVRRVAKGKLKKARFYAAFRVSQSPNSTDLERRENNGKGIIISNRNSGIFGAWVDKNTRVDEKRSF